MPETIIRVENLGKSYTIGRQNQKERYTVLRDVLANKAKGITRLFNPNAKIEYPNLEEFWALKNVSFEVKRGDRIGIIGRNGAGKSTLLKILSRITEPTEGRISIKGRVASLLEVGTGFHPELTGRENIFLNGAILGMSKVEITRKFDEIIAFSEVERFLDTPVKRYSSGMYVRLAFAVAAHLEPEILIIDEVLAVGDIQFQKKCLGKMQNISNSEGKTVLFVSHNLQAIEALCNKGFFFQNGELISAGTTQEIARNYINHTTRTILNNCLQEKVPLYMDYVLDSFNISPGEVYIGETLDFSLSLNRSDEVIKIDDLALLIYSMSGIRLAVIDLRTEARRKRIATNRLMIRGSIDRIPFVEGEYSVGIYMKVRGFSKNFLDLIKFIVKQDRSAEVVDGAVILPYAAKHLGLVELNYSITSFVV